MSVVESYSVTVYMAGDVDTAKAWLRVWAYQKGACVTVTPTTFIYTGGEESGFAIGFVNYPRFPSAPGELWERAHAVATMLVQVCSQRTALVVAPDRTERIQIAPPGARE